MKKTLCALLVVMVMMLPFTIGTTTESHATETSVATSSVTTLQTMYAEDGRTISIPLSEVEAYKNVGWYETYEEVCRTLYSQDGRSLVVYKAEVNTYLNQGWYHYDDVTTTLYTPEGKSLTIFDYDVDTYLKLGWCTYQNATTTLFAGDGRELTVFNCEVDTYLKLGWFKKIVIDPSRPVIAFTFDDGPHASNTKVIVDTLKQYNCSATFFVLGRLVSAYPTVVKYAFDSGMEIGNHSTNHANLTSLSAASLASDISTTSSRIYNATGAAYPKLLRPPYGATNATVKTRSGLPSILWSVDTLDWKTRNAVSVYNHILNNVKDGDIVLMHDIHTSTVEAVKMVVPELVKRGYQIVSVSELAKAKGYTINNGNTYTNFK